MNRLDRVSLEKDLAREEARLTDLEAQYERVRSTVDELRRQVGECRELSSSRRPVVAPGPRPARLPFFALRSACGN